MREPKALPGRFPECRSVALAHRWSLCQSRSETGRHPPPRHRLPAWKWWRWNPLCPQRLSSTFREARTMMTPPRLQLMDIGMNNQHSLSDTTPAKEEVRACDALPEGPYFHVYRARQVRIDSEGSGLICVPSPFLPTPLMRS